MKKFREFAFDAKPTSKYAASRAIEREFARALRKIARASGHLVEAHIDGHKITDPEGMKKALKDYSRLLTPWAKVQVKKLTEQSLRRLNSDKGYREHTKKIGEGMSEAVFQSEVGAVSHALMLEQVELIRSIPIEAGERAQALALEGLAGGRRADEIASELKQTTEVTESRAKLIARTETARASAVFNQARATSVGSTHYRWRNSGDGAVRDSHRVLNGRKLDGQVFSWGDPPTLDDGTTGHPGTFPNCRCYAEPILPDDE